MKTIDNHAVICHDFGEVNGQVIAFSEQGYHLVSCHNQDGIWYLTFSNWVSIVRDK